MADAAAPPRSLTLLAFAASLRRESLNRKLLALALPRLRGEGVDVSVIDFRELVFPYYDGDEEKVHGIPQAVQALGGRIASSDGIVIASPEYNFTMPGTLKNTIDWVSRLRPYCFKDRWVLLLSASPTLTGGNRGLWNTRVPLESMGAMVFPDMFSLAQANKGFTDTGALADQALAQRLDDLIVRFVGALRRARA